MACACYIHSSVFFEQVRIYSSSLLKCHQIYFYKWFNVSVKVGPRQMVIFRPINLSYYSCVFQQIAQVCIPQRATDSTWVHVVSRWTSSEETPILFITPVYWQVRISSFAISIIVLLFRFLTYIFNAFKYCNLENIATLPCSVPSLHVCSTIHIIIRIKINDIECVYLRVIRKRIYAIFNNLMNGDVHHS